MKRDRYTILRSALLANGVEVSAFAAALGVTRQHLRLVAIGERVSERVGKAIDQTIATHRKGAA